MGVQVLVATMNQNDHSLIKKMNINLLAFPGHKSLFGLQGTGGLYISDNLL